MGTCTVQYTLEVFFACCKGSVHGEDSSHEIYGTMMVADSVNWRALFVCLVGAKPLLSLFGLRADFHRQLTRSFRRSRLGLEVFLMQAFELLLL